MINPAVIERFLSRKLDNYDWFKQEPVAAVDEELKGLTPPPDFTGWWLHQKVAFLLIEALKRFMLHLDMGAGKTLIVLSIIKYRKQRGEKPKAIVFVPYITSVETWVEECAKHTPELACVPLLGSTAENRQRLENDSGDLFVICYQSAVAALATSSKKASKGKNKWSIDPRLVRRVFSTFDALIMDEVHKAKSIQSLTYKVLRTISAQCEYVVGLTGTPFGRDLQDLWPQFYLIDFGDTLGETFGLYREAFFTKKINYWGGYEYKFKKKLFGRLQELIKNSSIRYNVEEFSDMQKCEYIIKKLEPAEGIKAYAEKAIAAIKQVLVKNRKKYREIESEYLKLRQLSSGFMTLKGEDNDRVQIKFDENPKLDALQELVESLPAGRKLIVFHHFIYTNVLISERLTTLGVDHARIYSKTKNPINELRRFKTDDKCRVLVINSQSGSSSLNLQRANYVVFFEAPNSAIDRQQAERRVWRPGQEQQVFVYDLIMKGTWDSKIHKANAEGRDLLTSLLDGQESA